MAEQRRESRNLRHVAIELAAISESALAYCQDPFDIERFHRIGEIARELLQKQTDEVLPVYDRDIASVLGYTTPKLDVRGGVFNVQGQVLLVREVADDNRWTLPGGWCDVLEPPGRSIEREILEEAGVAVTATHLAAVIDRELWPYTPLFDQHTYKMYFVCEPVGEISLDFESIETNGVEWFDVDRLPELSVARVLPEHIKLLHDHWQNPQPTYFD